MNRMGIINYKVKDRPTGFSCARANHHALLLYLNAKYLHAIGSNRVM